MVRHTDFNSYWINVNQDHNTDQSKQGIKEIPMKRQQNIKHNTLNKRIECNQDPTTKR